MKPAITTIQKVMKAGKILSRIVFVLCIVLACLLTFALVFYIVVGDRILTFGGISFYGLIQQETGAYITPALMITATICGIISCVAEIVLSQFAVTYFRRELEDGTPFTYHGAKELKRLGFLAMFIPLGVSLISGIALAVVNSSGMGLPGEETGSFRITLETGGSFGVGIAMLIVSAFCRHGAQMEESRQWAASRQWNGAQGQANPQWTPNPQWTQQQANQQWTDQQQQMNQQWAKQQAQANQQWAKQQAQAGQQWAQQQAQAGQQWNQQQANQQWTGWQQVQTNLQDDRQDPAEGPAQE